MWILVLGVRTEGDARAHEQGTSRPAWNIVGWLVAEDESGGERAKRAVVAVVELDRRRRQRLQRLRRQRHCYCSG